MLATAFAARAVDLTGNWVICADCRIAGVCDPTSYGLTNIDEWGVMQSSSTLTVMESIYSLTLTGTIDSTSGAFDLPRPQNLIAFEGVGTFSTIDGTYDAILQTGHITGARRCNPAAPACNDGDPCTIDACVTTTIGTCTDYSPYAVCTNTQSGACVTTTTSSTTTSTTTSSLPLGHYPVTGQKLVLKRSASGRQTLIFVTKDPTAFVPAIGGPDDPTTVRTQIELHSPAGDSGSFGISTPPGVGKPGWQVKAVPGPQYKFTNSFAPAGISAVRTIKMRAGKGLKIVARATGLPMTALLGSAGISIRFDDASGGYPIVCAHFGAATVRKDVPPVFIARPSPAPENCYATTLRAP